MLRQMKCTERMKRYEKWNYHYRDDCINLIKYDAGNGGFYYD